jgi:O-antigen/teichoic acid export membrane protein
MWRKVGRDSAILLASAGALALFQVAYRYLSVQELSVADYGRVALLLSIFNAAAVIGSYGIPATISRLAAGGRSAKDHSLLRSATVALLGPCAVAVLIVGASTYFVTGSVLDAAIAAVGVPPMIWAGLYTGFIRGKGMIWAAGAIQPASVLLQVVVLGLFVLAGESATVGIVLASFYIGNFGAYGCAWLFRHRALRRPVDPCSSGPAAGDANARSILTFSVWLSLANVAVLLLAILPRISLAQFSYRDVAIFDLALLIYTVPQRLRSSFLLALLPIATVERRQNAVIKVPNGRDLLFVTAIFVAIDALLWATEAPRYVLETVGMSSYVGAEPLILVILLAAPAELFFGLNSGLLQAFGESRKLFIIGLGVLVVAVALSPVMAMLGSIYLAIILVLAYWALHFLSRRMLRHNGVVEEAVLIQGLTERWQKLNLRRSRMSSGATLSEMERR